MCSSPRLRRHPLMSAAAVFLAMAAAPALGQSPPSNSDRPARETLAFVMESRGDLEGERALRAALAAEFPDDPRTQADYGRVLERSGDDPGALAAYRRA